MQRKTNHNYLVMKLLYNWNFTYRKRNSIIIIETKNKNESK